MKLMEYLPDELYSGEEHVVDLQDAIGEQAEGLAQARADLMLQCRPASATWGLERYEQEYGIAPDHTLSFSQRLAAWRAKRRGRGTTTLTLVEQVAQSFSKEPVRAVEYPEQYRFALRFSAFDRRNAVPLYRALDEIRPAHLACGLVFVAKAPQTAAAKVGAFASVAQRITVYPYLPPSVEVESKLSVQSYVSTAVKITVGGI